MGPEDRRPGAPRAVVALAVLLALEAAGVAVLVVVLLVQVVTTPSYSLSSSIALIVLAALTAVGLAAVARATLHGRSWSRSAAIVWQIVQLGVGFYAFQGADARPDLGALLVVPALIGLGLLFTRSVQESVIR